MATPSQDDGNKHAKQCEMAGAKAVEQNASTENVLLCSPSVRIEELGFEVDFFELVSRCSGVENHWFSSEFFNFRDERYCNSVGPIFLQNSYQQIRYIRWTIFEHDN
jgi:hypothetical protein